MKKRLLLSSILLLTTLPLIGQGILDLSGYGNLCAIREDRSLWCWGQNRQGQLGLGHTSYEHHPVQIPLHPENIPVAIDSGSHHNCVLFENGKMKCWGHNLLGKLGIPHKETYVGNDPNEKMHLLPYVDVGTNKKIMKVALGWHQTCIITHEGEVKCWGSNRDGALAIGSPVATAQVSMGDQLPSVSLGGKARDLCGGNDFFCALLGKNSVKCWGNYRTTGQENGNVNIGIHAGQMGENLPPIRLGKNERIEKISCGNGMACALFEDSTLKCWGDNYQGRVGIGTTERIIGDESGEMGQNLPNVNLGVNPIDISCGGDHCCALTENSSIKCWGFNRSRLGNGTSASAGLFSSDMGNSLGFVKLGKFTRAQKLFSLRLGSCALTHENDLKCWGYVPKSNVEYTAIGLTPEQLGENLKPIPFQSPPRNEVRAIR